MCQNDVRDVQDFQGQKLVTQILTYSLVGVPIFACLLGSVARSFELMTKAVTLAAIILGVVCLPAWPMYSRDPVKWREPDNKNETHMESPTNDSDSSTDSDEAE